MERKGREEEELEAEQANLRSGVNERGRINDGVGILLSKGTKKWVDKCEAGTNVDESGSEKKWNIITSWVSAPAGDSKVERG